MAEIISKFQNKNSQSVIIKGDGRKLPFVEDYFFHAIVTDHPWMAPKSNNGGNRSFADYDCFEYTLEDFKEKARVLKNGCFLVEVLPSENAENFRYLYRIKDLAEQAGFQYYAKIPWKKGTFVSNTGRCSKNTEDIMFFTKGKARSLRPDVKKNQIYTYRENFMSGTKKMLPTNFDIQAVGRNEKIHQSEKPVHLYKQILDLITLPNEKILDQFAGSGALGIAALQNGYNSVLIEKDNNAINNIIKRFENGGYEYV